MAEENERLAEARAWELHQKARDVLFSNETFFIGMLQAVSGASVFAALAQSEAMSKLGGRFLPLTFLTSMVVALISAVLAAYWKHQYKLWDVKMGAAANSAERAQRHAKAGCYLTAMRYSMLISVLAIVLAFATVLLAAWVYALCPPVAAS